MLYKNILANKFLNVTVIVVIAFLGRRHRVVYPGNKLSCLGNTNSSVVKPLTYLDVLMCSSLSVVIIMLWV